MFFQGPCRRRISGKLSKYYGSGFRVFISESEFFEVRTLNRASSNVKVSGDLNFLGSVQAYFCRFFDKVFFSVRKAECYWAQFFEVHKKSLL